MLTELNLVNFKRFSKARIPLKKINIFVGPNNSGKSSILAAIKLLKQTLDSYDEQVPLLLNGALGDFGTFKDIVYKNHRGRPLEIGFKLLTTSSIMPDGPQIEADLQLFFKYNSHQREIILENIDLKTKYSNLINLKYSKESSRFNLERHGDVEIPPSFKPRISRDIRIRHFLPIPLSVRLGQLGMTTSSGKTPVAQFAQENLNIELTRQVLRITRRIGEYLDASDYLGPVRSSPQRTYLFTGERRSRIGAGGENMTTLLVKGQNSNGEKTSDTVLSKVNDWLIKSKMARAVEISAISDRHYEIQIANFVTGEKQNIADVGYGHSQVLPLLVGGYSMSPRSMFLVEQPELHLHPKAQAELGDFFLDLFESGVQTLIETHSEHLILRLQQHIASGAVNPVDIAVYYIKNTTESEFSKNEIGSPEIIPLRIDESGTFIDPWPEGFFPERLNEARKLAQIRHAKSTASPE
jgi:predicted ATPase